jgi:serine/threonine-protein kinase
MKASRNVDMRADIWAVGVMFYELLTGDVPFKGDSLPELCAVIVLDGVTPKARDVVPELPEGVDELIGRCLARQRDERFANAAEVARALAPFAPERARLSVDRVTDVLGPMASLRSISLTDSPAVAPDSATGGAWTDTKPEKKRKSTLVLGAALGTLALAGVGALAFVGGSTEAGRTHGAPPAGSETPRPEVTVVPLVPVAPAAPATASAAATALPAPVASATRVPPATSASARVPAAEASAAATAKTAGSSSARPARPVPKEPEPEENPFGGRR